MLKISQFTHFALREVFDCLPRRRTLLGALIFSVLIGMQGPFGTFDALLFFYRVPYFVFLIFFTFVLPVSFFTCFFYNSKAEGSLRSVLIILFGISLVFITASTVYGVNYLIWGVNERTPTFLQCFGMSLPVAFFQTLNILFGWISFLHPDNASPLKNKPRLESKTNVVHVDGDGDGSPSNCMFLKRLPDYLGTELQSLSSKDHFITAKTPAGSFDIRMRFSDALTEVSSINGIQIHRSHWVAINAIIEIQKIAGKHYVILKSGLKLPVSRGRQTRVNEFLKSFPCLRAAKIRA